MEMEYPDARVIKKKSQGCVSPSKTIQDLSESFSSSTPPNQDLRRSICENIPLSMF